MNGIDIMDDAACYWTFSPETKNLFYLVGNHIKVSYVGDGPRFWEGSWIFEGYFEDDGVYVLRDETDNKVRVVAASRVVLSELGRKIDKNDEINEVRHYERK